MLFIQNTENALTRVDLSKPSEVKVTVSIVCVHCVQLCLQ